MLNRFRINGIEKVRFAVTEFEDACTFASQWGLSPAASDAAGAFLFRAQDGSEVEIVRAEPADPRRRPLGNSSGLSEITWGVSDEAALHALEAELCRDRAVEFDGDGVLHSVDDLGIRLAFRVTRRAEAPVEATRYNSPTRTDRLNQRAVRYDQARPHQISHVAMGVDDAAAAAQFYIERLGFIVSDRYANRGLFLRCSPSGNHHHLFLMNGRTPGTRLNHMAFKVRDVHEVIGGGQYIDSKGWKTFAGPGRHTVSSACFWYFLTPLGCAWEYAADEDIVNESWEAADFAATADIFSEWTFGLEKSDGRLRGPISVSKEAGASPAVSK
ncbi:VOC family protein [Massilia cavernae]|uniref:Ring-cleaving dioxygenase n=1 Tax=Massilia cavernae TaxID=2320864 RepID=A0A418XDY4_9BURK|nr:VOC family protein [Massilia cavernae]RJG10726.1 ring-cleaving dioxygenase [Massilia cavernae]